MCQLPNSRASVKVRRMKFPNDCKPYYMLQDLTYVRLFGSWHIQIILSPWQRAQICSQGHGHASPCLSHPFKVKEKGFKGEIDLLCFLSCGSAGKHRVCFSQYLSLWIVQGCRVCACNRRGKGRLYTSNGLKPNFPIVSSVRRASTFPAFKRFDNTRLGVLPFT